MAMFHKEHLRAAGELVAEALWPTRCIACDAPGQVLCPACRARLRFVDQCDACPRCGAPYGRVQCTECNTYSLRGLGYRVPPYCRAVCAVHFDELAASIVRGRKDQGERRLDDYAAYCIACCVPPEWLQRVGCACPVPASARSLRLRGFDHGLALAQGVGRLLGLPCTPLLQTGRLRDQRGLSRRLRANNMRGAFQPAVAVGGAGVLLIDDVRTTGATLLAAAQALREGGAGDVYCATFACVC